MTFHIFTGFAFDLSLLICLSISLIVFLSQSFFQNLLSISFFQISLTIFPSQFSFHNLSFTISLSQFLFLNLSFSIFVSQSSFHNLSFTIFLSQSFFHNLLFTIFLLQSFFYNLSFTILLPKSFFHNLSFQAFHSPLFTIPVIKQIWEVAPDVVEENGNEDLEVHAVAECGVRLKRAIKVATKDGVPVPREK